LIVPVRFRTDVIDWIAAAVDGLIAARSEPKPESWVFVTTTSRRPDSGKRRTLPRLPTTRRRDVGYTDRVGTACPDKTNPALRFPSQLVHGTPWSPDPLYRSRYFAGQKCKFWRVLRRCHNLLAIPRSDRAPAVSGNGSLPRLGFGFRGYQWLECSIGDERRPFCLLRPPHPLSGVPCTRRLAAFAGQIIIAGNSFEWPMCRRRRQWATRKARSSTVSEQADIVVRFQAATSRPYLSSTRTYKLRCCRPVLRPQAPLSQRVVFDPQPSSTKSQKLKARASLSARTICASPKTSR